jgi:hypothetical protein
MRPNAFVLALGGAALIGITACGSSSPKVSNPQTPTSASPSAMAHETPSAMAHETPSAMAHASATPTR